MFNRRQGQEKEHIWGNITFLRHLDTVSENMLRGSEQGQQRLGEIMMEVQAGGHERTVSQRREWEMWENK